MFWELTGDSRDPEKSLLKHMNQILNAPAILDKTGNRN